MGWDLNFKFELLKPPTHKWTIDETKAIIQVCHGDKPKPRLFVT